MTRNDNKKRIGAVLTVMLLIVPLLNMWCGTASAVPNYKQTFGIGFNAQEISSGYRCSAPIYEEGVFGKLKGDYSLRLDSGYLSSYGADGVCGAQPEGTVIHNKFQIAIPKETTADVVALEINRVFTDAAGTVEKNLQLPGVPGAFLRVLEFQSDKSLRLCSSLKADFTWEADIWYDVDVVLTIGTAPKMSIYINGEPLRVTNGTFDGVKSTSYNFCVDGNSATPEIDPVYGFRYDYKLRWGASVVSTETVAGCYLDNVCMFSLPAGSQPEVSQAAYLESEKPKIDFSGTDTTIFTITNSGIAPAVAMDSDGNQYLKINAGGVRRFYGDGSVNSADFTQIDFDLKLFDTASQIQVWTANKYMADTRDANTGKYVTVPTYASDALTKSAVQEWHDSWVAHRLIVNNTDDTQKIEINGMPQHWTGYENTTVYKQNDLQLRISTANAENNAAGLDNWVLSFWNYKPQMRKLVYRSSENSTEDDYAVPLDTNAIELHLTGALKGSADLAANIIVTDMDGNAIAVSQAEYDSENKAVTLHLDDELQSATVYRVTMKQGMAVSPNVALEQDYTYEFKTSWRPFETKAAQLMKKTDNGEWTEVKASGIKAGDIIGAQVMMTNTSGMDKDCRAILGCYQEDRLIGFDMTPKATVGQDGAENQGNILNFSGITIPENIADISFKLFVWDDIITMNPINDCILLN